MSHFLKVVICVALLVLLCSGAEGNPKKKELHKKSWLNEIKLLLVDIDIC